MFHFEDLLLEITFDIWELLFTVYRNMPLLPTQITRNINDIVICIGCETVLNLLVSFISFRVLFLSSLYEEFLG